MTKRRRLILMAEDDDDDHMIVEKALKEAGLSVSLVRVRDGEELMEYLQKRRSPAHLPSLILLDLNMPRKDGREALREIKSDLDFCRIPVVVLTTSSAEQDVDRMYELGVSSFIRKPENYEDLVTAMRTLVDFWFRHAKLP